MCEWVNLQLCKFPYDVFDEILDLGGWDWPAIESLRGAEAYHRVNISPYQHVIVQSY